MIIGFLGKGGSGKSTLATKYALLAHNIGLKVLAIDADHNMDLAFNLGAPDDMNYLGTETINDLLKHIDQEGKKVKEILENAKESLFDLDKKDKYTQKYTSTSTSGIEIMVAGPQNYRVLRGDTCSHTLASPLKIYLPLLNTKDNHVVVVDEKASVDAVSTGIPCGFDLAVIVVENKLHSIKAGKQIAQALEIYNVPFIFVANKIKDEKDLKEIKEHVELSTYVEFDHDNPVLNMSVYDAITNKAKGQDSSKRLERALGRFKIKI